MAASMFRLTDVGTDSLPLVAIYAVPLRREYLNIVFFYVNKWPKDLLSTRYGLFTFIYLSRVLYWCSAGYYLFWLPFSMLLDDRRFTTFSSYSSFFGSVLIGALRKSLDPSCLVHSVFSSHHSEFYVLCSNDCFLKFCHYLFLMDLKDSPLQVSTLSIEEHPTTTTICSRGAVFDTTRTTLGYLQSIAATIAICAGTQAFPHSTSQSLSNKYRMGI